MGSWGIPAEERKGGSERRGRCLAGELCLEEGELTGLSHEGDVVGSRVEGSVEMQLECEGLAPAHDEPLQAHLLRVVSPVVPGALQVNGSEL